MFVSSDSFLVYFEYVYVSDNVGVDGLVWLMYFMNKLCDVEQH